MKTVIIVLMLIFKIKTTVMTMTMMVTTDILAILKNVTTMNLTYTFLSVYLITTTSLRPYQ